MLVCYFLASQASTDTVTSAADDLEEKPAKKSKKGKRVTWPDDDANLIFHYFEMDEDERGQFVPLFLENLVYIFPQPVHYLLLNDEFLRYHYWATVIFQSLTQDEFHFVSQIGK